LPRRRGSIDRLEPSVVNGFSDLLAAPCVIRDEVLGCESNGLTCIWVGEVGDRRQLDLESVKAVEATSVLL
jgi:hypothetical protein